MTSWADLTTDLRLLILSRLPLPDAIALAQAHPRAPHHAHVRTRIARLQPLRDAWVHAVGTKLRSYANPPHLRTRAARRALSPATFARLAALPVSGGTLESLSGVGELRNLRVLDASANIIASVPHEISQCTQLRVVNLGRNRLRAFPDVLFELPEVRTLLLHHNAISSLPEDWSALRHLYRLGLFDCGIRAPLPEQLCSLLGTSTEQQRRRSANLQRNRLDQGTVLALFRRFPLMASAVVI